MQGKHQGQDSRQDREQWHSNLVVNLANHLRDDKKKKKFKRFLHQLATNY